MVTTHTFKRGTRTVLAAGVLLGVAAAQAAGGFNVTREQEALARPGMRMSEVRQALGQPESNVKYGNEPGRTYTYHVMGSEAMLFEVDFGADGRVVSASERMDQSGEAR